MSKKLQFLNGGSCLLQLVLCILILVWVLRKDKEEPPFDFSVGEYDGIENDCNALSSPTLSTIAWILVGFTAITAVIHGIYALNLPFYVRAVARGNNWVRWLEYSVTATLMIVAIALLSGVSELDALILIAVCSSGTMLLGDTTERALIAGSKSAAVSATITGWILLIGAFSVIIRCFFRSINREDPDTPEPPAIVQYIVFVMFGLFSCFGGIQLFRNVIPNKISPARYNRNTEALYSIFSMIAKSALVLMVYGGLLGISSSEPTLEEVEGTELTGPTGI